MPPVVLVHPEPAAVADAAAQRLTAKVVELQAARGSASVVLTGGGVGIATLRSLLAGAGRTAIDWRAIDLWWGDERFLPTGHPDRNETQAREALLDHLDLDWSRVHPMAGPDGPDGDNPEAAAERYAAELARRRRRVSTSSCSGWVPRGTSPRSSRSHRPPWTNARSLPYETARSRRRPGSR